MLSLHLPSIDALLGDPRLKGLPHGLAVRAAREVVAEARQALRAGRKAPEDLAGQAAARAEELGRMRLRPVINATGIVLHTNLGRAPLAPEAAEAVSRVAGGYSSTELDLDTGRRGSRLSGVAPLLAELCAAEAALAVNNNAAAVLLVLSALAAGREVLVSRGELVEIGGAFRVPEVIAAGGARLVEVGTTNRTRVEDYARAITGATALILRVHPSNFRQVGFVERAPRPGLAALCRERGLPLVDDLGSGLLAPALDLGEEAEPPIDRVLAEGADIACFSCDKLLGGPQAGAIVGRRDLVEPLRQHALYRALRLDKLVLAALEATLLLYRIGAGERVPARALLARDAATCRLAAERLAEALPGAVVEADVGYSGGGALPGFELPGWVVAIRGRDPEALARALRQGDPAVVGRVARGALLLDPRTLLVGEEQRLLLAVRAALAALGE